MIKHKSIYCKKCGEVGHDSRTCTNKVPLWYLGWFIADIAKASGQSKCLICDKKAERFDIMMVNLFKRDNKVISVKKIHLKCWLNKIEQTREQLIGDSIATREMTQERNRMKARERYRAIHPKRPFDKTNIPWYNDLAGSGQEDISGITTRGTSS